MKKKKKKKAKRQRFVLPKRAFMPKHLLHHLNFFLSKKKVIKFLVFIINFVFQSFRLLLLHSFFDSIVKFIAGKENRFKIFNNFMVFT